MLSQIRHQEEATRFLRRVLTGTLVSPLLLLGQDGVGKRHSILCMMREALCLGSRTPDCQCAACYQVLHNLHSDIYLVSAAKHIDVKEVRSIVDEASNCPSASRFKAFVLDGADRFTIEAADALLKTLEEAPRSCRFFLLAENKAQVPPTIVSRCGGIVYRPLPDDFILSIVQRLEDDPSKSLVYTRMGEGSVGRAVDYCSAGKLSLRSQALRALQASVERDLPRMFSLVDAMKNDLELALRFIEQLLRDVLILALDPKRAIHVDVVEELSCLRTKVPVLVWFTVARKVAGIRASKANLNLSFQLKSILAESFV